MYRKLLFIEIVLALGIPAFPLGTLLSLPPENSLTAAVAKNTGGTGIKFPAPKMPPGENLESAVCNEAPPVAGAAGTGTEEQTARLKQKKAAPEQIALAFRPPAANSADGVLPDKKRSDGGNRAPIMAVPEKERYRESEKFRHLGSITDGGNREWLYLKDNESGRIIAVSTGGASRENLGLVSVDAESYVITKDNIEYLIRRN